MATLYVSSTIFVKNDFWLVSSFGASAPIKIPTTRAAKINANVTRHGRLPSVKLVFFTFGLV